MNRVILISLLVVGLPGCTLSGTANHRVDSPLEANKALLREFYEVVISTGDVDALSRYVGDDYTEVHAGQRNVIEAQKRADTFQECLFISVHVQPAALHTTSQHRHRCLVASASNPFVAPVRSHESWTGDPVIAVGPRC